MVTKPLSGIINLTIEHDQAMNLSDRLQKWQQRLLQTHPKLKEKLNASLGAFMSIWLLMTLISQLQMTMEMELLGPGLVELSSPPLLETIFVSDKAEITQCSLPT